MVSWLVLFASLALADQGVEPSELKKIETVVVPLSGWKLGQPESATLTATDEGRGLSVRVFATQWQFAVSDETAKAWGEAAIDRLRRQGKEEVAVTGTRVENGVAINELTFLKEGKPGVMVQRSVTGNGRVVHVAVQGPERSVVEEQAAAWFAATSTKAPESWPDPSVRSLEGKGFTLPLGDGWRPPLPAEQALATEITAGLGHPDPVGQGCALAVEPTPAGDSRVLLACPSTYTVAILDDYSREGEDLRLRGELFGKGAADHAPASAVVLADREGFQYEVNPSGKEQALLAVVPYDAGTVHTWMIGMRRDAASNTAVLKAAVEGTTFTGPDNGLPKHGFGDWASYAWTYRSTLVYGAASPFVLGLLALGWVFRPRGKRYEDIE